MDSVSEPMSTLQDVDVKELQGVVHPLPNNSMCYTEATSRQSAAVRPTMQMLRGIPNSLIPPSGFPKAYGICKVSLGTCAIGLLYRVLGNRDDVRLAD